MRIYVLEKKYEMSNSIIKILYNKDYTRKYIIGPYPCTITLSGSLDDVNALLDWIYGMYTPRGTASFEKFYSINEKVNDERYILNVVDPVLAILEQIELPSTIIDMAYMNKFIYPDSVREVLNIFETNHCGIMGRNNTMLSGDKLEFEKHHKNVLEKRIKDYYYYPESNVVHIDIIGLAK